ncbi:MAG: VWA domain-containing protein [Bryobacteraceae bacterium]
MTPRLAALFTCVALFAQQPQTKVTKPPVEPVDDTVTFRGRVNIVIAPTTVTDTQGQNVPGLSTADFKLYDNDKLQKIEQDITFQPLSIVVVVQANGKVDGILPKIRKIGNLFEPLVIGDAGELAVISFDHQIKVNQDFTNDPVKIRTAFENIKAGSNTSALIDAVTVGSRMLNRRPKNRRKVLLLIAETRDGGSEGKLREAVTNLDIYNISLYSVNINHMVSSLTQKPAYSRPDPIPATARHMPNGAAVTPETVASMHAVEGQQMNFAPLIKELYIGVKAIFIDNPVEVFTKYTGGKEYNFVTQRDLERAISDIGDRLHAEYLLSYNPNNKMEGGYHTIRVEVGRYGMRVATRPGYWMAAVPE